MSTRKFTPKQQQMLLKAQKVIEDASKDYVEILTQHIQALQEALKSENTAEAVQICYLIQTQAGTFGWPLAGELSGWFKRILKTQKKTGLNPTVSSLFCQSFTSIIQNELKNESDDAVKLLMHIECVLKTEGIR